MNRLSKNPGHHCHWLRVDGKEVANFNDESNVDMLIALEQEHTEMKALLIDVATGKLKKDDINAFVRRNGLKHPVTQEGERLASQIIEHTVNRSRTC